jgi:archaellum component FlaF (FlaF/FlaG flagellin family)
VSTGILLSAVAIMGSMLTAWSNSIFANEQHELNTVYAESVNKLNEFLVIEHVWFGNSPSKFINLTMSNVGNNGLNVTKITLDNSIDRTDLLITNGGIVQLKKDLSIKLMLWGHETKKSFNYRCWRGIFLNCNYYCS